MNFKEACTEVSTVVMIKFKRHKRREKKTKYSTYNIPYLTTLKNGYKYNHSTVGESDLKSIQIFPDYIVDRSQT